MVAKDTFKENALRIVAVLGLIAVLLLGAWGIIQLAFFLPSFFGNVGDNIRGVFTREAEEAPAVSPPPQANPEQPAQSGSAAAPSPKPPTAPSSSSNSPQANYVPSGKTAQLYGYPDLKVSIVSNPGSVRAGQRISFQFIIENAGTNATPGNWSFTATLPYNPPYTYQSPGQQALYPGDKIVYTLAYDAPYAYNRYQGNQYCVMIYPPPPGCDYNYGGYADSGYYYPYNQYGAAYGYQPQTATIQVDPYNFVWESSEYNNSAAVSYAVY